MNTIVTHCHRCNMPFVQCMCEMIRGAVRRAGFHSTTVKWNLPSVIPPCPHDHPKLLYKVSPLLLTATLIMNKWVYRMKRYTKPMPATAILGDCPYWLNEDGALTVSPHFWAYIENEPTDG